MKNFVLFSILFFTSFNVLAQATANSDGNWSDTGSWQGNNIGDGGEDVTMNANIDLIIQAGESYTIGALDVGKTGSVTINAGGLLIINGTLVADKEFTINVAGTLTLNGNMDVAKTLALNVTGTMTVDGNVNMAKDAGVTVDGSLGVTGSFSSAQNATVTINGDMDVDGDLNLGAGSTILGTGPVSTGTCSGDACGDEQLPVDLVYFNVKADAMTAIIEWATLSEEDNDFFTVQRSKDGISWEEIATVQGSGNSNERLEYSYMDRSPYIGVSFYRLSQTDFDGTTETFDIEMVQLTTIDRLSIFPNPAKRNQEVRVATGAMPDEIINIEIIDQAGHVLQIVSTNGDQASVQVDSSLNPGIYLVRMTSGKVVKLSRLVIR